MLNIKKITKLLLITLTVITIIGSTVYGKVNEVVIQDKIEDCSTVTETREEITAETPTKKEYKSPAPTANPGTVITTNPDGTTTESNGIDGGDILDGVAGILLLPAKAIIILLGEAIRIILGFFAGEGGEGLTIQKILFNDLPLTDINFFDFNSSSIDPAVKAIRQNVATWYIGVRNLAAVLLVIVAIYVGLRMAISTIAEDKAKYKQMLIDWLTSLCLLFILHYIMVLVIQLNNTLVKTIGESVSDSKLNDVAREFANQAWANVSFSKGMAEALAFLLLEFMTLLYLVSYIRRMITIGFLIIIAPLVTVTYSIDRMGDGKSQALNAWFKEFAYNILIQPFQCVTYLALCATSLEMLDSKDLKSAVLAICMLIFLNTSEKIIKSIFNFRAGSMSDTFANAAIMTAAVNGFTNIGKSFAKGGDDEGSSPSEKLQRETRREKALPTNSSSRNVQMHDDVSNQAIATGASAAALDSASEERAYSVGSQGNNNGGDNNGNNDNNQSGNNTRESSNNEKGKKKGHPLIAKAGKVIIGANTVFLGTAVGAIAGAATGDFKAGVTGGMSGFALGRGIKQRGMNTIINREINNRTSNALEDYKKQRGNISDKQIIEEGMSLLDGTRDARTDEERELRDALMEMYDRRIKLGDDEEDGLDNTEKKMQELLDNNREGKKKKKFPLQVPRKEKKKQDREPTTQNRFNNDGESTNGGSDEENSQTRTREGRSTRKFSRNDSPNEPQPSNAQTARNIDTESTNGESDNNVPTPIEGSSSPEMHDTVIEQEEAKNNTSTRESERLKETPKPKDSQQTKPIEEKTSLNETPKSETNNDEN
ncbi:MAG: hypothetical protein IKG14_00855 [Clostridia bacterium]|nr:hypothetical protein [Clostridia bacterium]MBR3324585.1 hypothetical protein [Clostridia bacterium]